MSTRLPYSTKAEDFLRGFAVQSTVIGALLMREIHTRYGRDNVGYLWLIGEPMILASVIGLMHSTGRSPFGSDLAPLPVAVVGYTIFIMFRGIVTRSEGALEANTPLLFHRMVTVFDIITARALLEAAGTVATLAILLFVLNILGLAGPPARPLYLAAAIGLVFWISLAHSLIISAISHENRTVARLVHPYSYFMIPLSGAFFEVAWLPHPYREYILWLPLPHMFEIARYGQFRSASPDYYSFEYAVGWCLILSFIGLILSRGVRANVHVHN